VATQKKTMYEILGVPPTASLADIKAAHKRLSLAIISGSLGLSREECNYRLNLLDVALNTLSVPAMRDSYDAQLAAAAVPGKLAVPVKTNIASLGNESKALSVFAAIENNYKIAAAGLDNHPIPLKEIASTVGASTRALKSILRTLIGLAILGFVLKTGQWALSHRQAGHPPIEVVKAEEKLIIQEYYKKHGVRPASRAEAEFLEKEHRRQENEQREAAFAEKRKEEEYRRFVEESREIGDRVTAERIYAEERERREEMQKQRYLAEQKRQQEEAEKEAEDMHIENERRKLGLN